MTGFFDAAGKELTPAELRARRVAFNAAADSVRVVVELLDANGQRVTTVALPMGPALAALVASARIIPDVDPTAGIVEGSTSAQPS